MRLRNFVKTFERKVRLFLIFFVRIVFVKGKLPCAWHKKLRANFFGGYLADQWTLYDLDRNNKKNYLSEYDWYRSRYINEPFGVLLNNKILASEYLKQYVRVPENYITKPKQTLIDFTGKIIGYHDAIRLIQDKKSVIVKPIDRGKGADVCLFSFNGGGFFFDTKPCSENDILEYLTKKSNWFLSEAIEQHDYASVLYDKTVNTMRIITLRSPHTQEMEIFFAVQRIGTVKTVPVDNGSQGGLVAKISLDTGVLSEARTLHGLDTYETHPDSGSRIKGITVPGWSDIKKQILELAHNLPYMNFIAWDVLKTPDGLCVIEANSSSGVNIIQLWGGQRNGMLGEFYRFNNIIK